MMFTTLRRHFLKPKMTARVRPEKRRKRLLIEELGDRIVPASLYVNPLDVAPGAIATFTGTEFATGENVTVSLVADNGVSEFFVVTDGGLGDLDGLADGNFTYEWLCDPSGAYLDATITATATGNLGSSAFTIFTDSGGGTPTNIVDITPLIIGDAGWTLGGSNGVNPVTVVTGGAGFTVTKIAIKTGSGGGFVIQNLTTVSGDQNTGSRHSPVIIANGFLGNGNAFSTNVGAMVGSYYSVIGLGTSTATVTRVGAISGGGLSHVDYFLNPRPVCADDSNSMTEDGTSVGGNVLSNDTDAEPLTVFAPRHLFRHPRHAGPEQQRLVHLHAHRQPSGPGHRRVGD